MMIGAGKYCIGHNSPFKTSRGKPMLGDDNNTMPAYHTCSSNSHKYTQKRPQELSHHSKHFKSHAKNFTDSFCALCKLKTFARVVALIFSSQSLLIRSEVTEDSGRSKQFFSNTWMFSRVLISSEMSGILSAVPHMSRPNLKSRSVSHHSRDANVNIVVKNVFGFSNDHSNFGLLFIKLVQRI